eukprot:TRINITY_DN874_c0_g1_i1.p1 TRINITY_DN874_c0_g1~~TRINITY_DN874_c0_g1_i1.p1  ORF type:complete len:511 (+),score=67.90 TRINITY_DN874_c0_g1_i1:72-1604(+)
MSGPSRGTRGVSAARSRSTTGADTSVMSVSASSYDGATPARSFFHLCLYFQLVVAACFFWSVVLPLHRRSPSVPVIVAATGGGTSHLAQQQLDHLSDHQAAHAPPPHALDPSTSHLSATGAGSGATRESDSNVAPKDDVAHGSGAGMTGHLPPLVYEPEIPNFYKLARPAPELRRCKEPGQYARGRWVVNEDKRQLFPCLTGEGCGNCDHAFWRPRGGETFDHIMEILRDPARREMVGIRRQVKPDWYPDDCDLLPWNRKAFCTALGRRNILMVGDSLMLSMAKTLYKFLRPTWPHPNPGCPTNFVVCDDVFPDRPPKITYVRNNDLGIINPAAHPDLPEHKRPSNWVVEIPEADILVFNAGAHYRPDEEYLSLQQNATRLLRERFPDETDRRRRLFYINTVQGHFGCQGHPVPLSKIPPVPPAAYKYHWQYFDHHNKNISEPLWNSIGATIIDAWSILGVRPDGHNPPDCLHYCLPGPYDGIIQIFYNMLAGWVVDGQQPPAFDFAAHR